MPRAASGFTDMESRRSQPQWRTKLASFFLQPPPPPSSFQSSNPSSLALSWNRTKGWSRKTPETRRDGNIHVTYLAFVMCVGCFGNTFRYTMYTVLLPPSRWWSLESRLGRSAALTCAIQPGSRTAPCLVRWKRPSTLHTWMWVDGLDWLSICLSVCLIYLNPPHPVPT